MRCEAFYYMKYGRVRQVFHPSLVPSLVFLVPVFAICHTGRQVIKLRFLALSVDTHRSRQNARLCANSDRVIRDKRLFLRLFAILTRQGLWNLRLLNGTRLSTV